MNIAHISTEEEFSYDLGDTGCNLVQQAMVLFMARFYVDIFDLSPAHMGTVFLVVRVLDAMTGVLMGAIADRTRTEYGQFQPYILWFAIPFGILCCLTFYTPGLGYSGKLIYAYASYTLLSLVYTAISVPYCAMIDSISNDSYERVSPWSQWFALNTLGGLAASLTVPPLVAWPREGNLQNGYFRTMMVIDVSSIIPFFTRSGLAKGRYSASIIANNQSSILGDLKTPLANKDWCILFTLNVVSLVAVLFKGGTTLYYVNNIVGRADLDSLSLTTTLTFRVVGAMLSPFIFKNVDEVKGSRLSTALEAVPLIVTYSVPAGSVATIFTLVIIINIIQLAATPLQWSMLSDIINTKEKRSGRKPNGIAFSTNPFTIKLGVAIGGALMGYLLTWGNYVGDIAQQSASALQIIKLLFTLFPGVLAALLIVIINRYSLDDKRLSHMAQESGG